MAKKEMISQEKAIERFKAKLLSENHGHELKVVFTGTQYEYSGEPYRDQFKVECSKCGEVNTYPTHVNVDGSIGAAPISQANSHIIIKRPQPVVDKEAYLVLSVKMKRGDDRELWVAHFSDSDFLEAIDKKPYSNYYGSYNQWRTFHKDSRGVWKNYGSYATEAEAIGSCTAYEVGFKHKGYETTVHVKDSDIGLTPVTATVKLSVKSLINDYKTNLRSGATPMEIKPWLEKVEDAITQIEVLEAFHAEVQERFQKSLEI